MGHIATTITAWQQGVEDCGSCPAPTIKLIASGPNDVSVTLISPRGEAATGTFTPKQLYELATLSAQVLVAQSEARHARQP